MASQAATLMGTSLPSLRTAAAPAAATARASVMRAVPRAAVDSKVLEAKSIGELRAMAKERGMRGDTKAELVKILMSTVASTQQAAPANGAATSANGAATSASSAAYRRQLEVMPLAQLRAVARTKGIFGSTKAELVSELIKSGPAVPAPTNAAPVATNGAVANRVTAAAPAASSASSALARQLSVKPLSVLRALARQKGIRATTKDEIVEALVASTPAAVAAAAPPAAAPVAAPAATPASAPSAAVSGATGGANAQTLARQLQTRPLSALRAMANAKGFSGAAAPKDQLIRMLVAAATETAVSVTTAKAATSVKANELQAKPLAELRTIARARGIRGDTKAELVKLLSVEESVLPPLASAASINIPFQSDVSPAGTTAITTVQPAPLTPVSPGMDEAMELLLGRAPGQPADSLAEQAAFLRNVLIGGIGVAMLPLLLPVQMSTTVVAPPAPPAPAPPVVVAPPAEPAVEVRELSAEEFCASLPASLLSPQAAKFCQAVAEMKL